MEQFMLSRARLKKTPFGTLALVFFFNHQRAYARPRKNNLYLRWAGFCSKGAGNRSNAPFDTTSEGGDRAQLPEITRLGVSGKPPFSGLGAITR